MVNFYDEEGTLVMSLSEFYNTEYYDTISFVVRISYEDFLLTKKVYVYYSFLKGFVEDLKKLKNGECNNVRFFNLVDGDIFLTIKSYSLDDFLYTIEICRMHKKYMDLKSFLEINFLNSKFKIDTLIEKIEEELNLLE